MGERDRNSPRAAPKEPIDSVLDQLYDLKKRLDRPVVQGDSALEMYDYFTRVSDQGRDCTYARKGKHIFLTKDWEEVKRELLQLLLNIRLMPGESEFGKK